MYLKKYFNNCAKVSMLVALCALASCRVNKKEFVEPVKDISGTWRVTKVVQNNNDITAFVDLSQFSVQFNKDKSYVLTGRLPFIVLENGTWAFNDPQYPFSISFTPASTNTKVSSNLAFTIVGNQYQMGISFVNGCDNYQNTYQYILNQVTTK